MVSVRDAVWVPASVAELQFPVKSFQSPVKPAQCPFQSPAKSPAKPGQSPCQSPESLLRLATPLRNQKCSPSVGTVERVGIEEAIPTRHVEPLKQRLAELRRNVRSPGILDLLFDDSNSDVSLHELETYKKAVESTIVVQQDHEDEQQMELAIANGRGRLGVEWQDSATGVRMGYAAHDEDDEDERNVSIPMKTAEEEFYASAMDDQQEHREVQESCEWEDNTSGAVLGFAACDSGAEDEVIELGYAAGAEDEVIELGVISQEAVDSSSMMTYDNAPLQITSEWRDQSTGIMMEYAFCEDITMEWKDQSTGVMMGYAFCDEGSEFEIQMEELACTATGNEAAAVAVLHDSAITNPKRRRVRGHLSKVARVARSAKRQRIEKDRQLATNYWDVLSTRHETDADE